MSFIVILTLLILGAFLFWFGYEVGSGRHKPDPDDHFFPLLGRNIDYVIGTAGTLMSIGMFVLAFGVWAELRATNYIAALFVIAGIARAYLPPKQFGPSWYRKKTAKKPAPTKSKKRKK